VEHVYAVAGAAVRNAEASQAGDVSMISGRDVCAVCYSLLRLLSCCKLQLFYSGKACFNFDLGCDVGKQS
jgi:hypothetical protein